MTNGNGSKDDFVGKLFVRKTKKDKLKLIEFSKEWEARTDEEKIKYLHRLASSLNEAAQQIQKERDELNKILFQKEAELVALKKQMEVERMMIHKQLEAENKKQQKLLEENQNLRRKTRMIAEKEGGDKH